MSDEVIHSRGDGSGRTDCAERCRTGQRFLSIDSISRLVIAISLVTLSIDATAAESDEMAGGVFEGTVGFERLDDDPFVPKLRLTEELLFRQADGRVWVTPANAVIDGRSMPTLLVQLIGHPFESEFRKTAISYDYAVKSKRHSWEDAQRMFYAAAVAEGVVPGEAKVMYMLLRAQGSRWALHGPNSCFSRCHTDAEELEWRPRVDDEKLVSVVRWVRAEAPSLNAIDQRTIEVIIEKGPHIFGAIR